MTPPGRRYPSASPRACGQVVGVFVLRVSRVPLDPAPLDPVARRDRKKCLPKLQVFDLATLALPPACSPAMHPFRHGVNQVAAVGGEHHPRRCPQCTQRGHRARDRHAVVGGIGLRGPEVSPAPTPLGMIVLNQAGRPARSRPAAELIPQTRFIRIHVNQRSVHTAPSP